MCRPGTAAAPQTEPNVGARIACTGRLDERLRWIDRGDGIGADPGDELRGERARPQPTSITRCPASTPARSASCAESSTEYRPMNRSYASAATSKAMPED